MSKRVIYLVCLGLLLGLVVSVQDANAAVVKSSDFSSSTLGDEDWTVEFGAFSLDTVNQEADQDGDADAYWDISGVSGYMGDGDVWTFSFDVRMTEMPDIKLLLGRGGFSKSAGDRMLELVMEDDGTDWRFNTRDEEGEDTSVTKGLAFDQWYHVDYVVNRSGAELTDYLGTGEDLADDAADLWIDGELGFWNYDILDDWASGNELELAGLFGVAYGSFDNFEIRDEAYVFIEETDYRVIDDMESYNTNDNADVDASWIFYVFKDGLGDWACEGGPGNGSGANLWCQTQFDAGGSKAMKFDYDNDGMVLNPCSVIEGNPVEEARDFLYSKAKAERKDLPSGIGPDWTLGGAKALRLYFHGDPNNIREPMFVELTDSSGGKATVAYGGDIDEDVNDINDASWRQWNIALQDFNDGDTPVNLTDVNSIAIIIGDGADEPNGSGIVYFDEIRLYPATCVLSKRSADFAKADYVDDDCKINYLELDLMLNSWLLNDYNIPAHGTLIDFPSDDSQWVDGNKANALDFNDIDGYVELPTGLLGSDIGSASFWIKTTQAAQGHIFYGSDVTGANGGGSANELHVNMRDDGKVRLWITEDCMIDSALVVNDDAWHPYRGHLGHKR